MLLLNLNSLYMRKWHISVTGSNILHTHVHKCHTIQAESNTLHKFRLFYSLFFDNFSRYDWHIVNCSSIDYERVISNSVLIFQIFLYVCYIWTVILCITPYLSTLDFSFAVQLIAQFCFSDKFIHKLATR